MNIRPKVRSLRQKHTKFRKNPYLFNTDRNFNWNVSEYQAQILIPFITNMSTAELYVKKSYQRLHGDKTS